MATAEVRFQPEKRLNGRRATSQRRPAVLRLLEAERSEEIFPLLLEEIIALGYARAIAVDVNFDTGDVTPAAALKWPRQSLQNFTTALWMSEHQMVSILHATRPAVLSKSSLHSKPVYVHPIFYSNRNVCWEADRLRTASCLAVQNFRKEKRIRLEDQVCTTFEMCSYSAVIVELVPKSADEQDIRELGEHSELAYCVLYRLFNVQY